MHGFQVRPFSLRYFFLHPGVEKPGHSMASFSGKLLLLVQWVQGIKKQMSKSVRRDTMEAYMEVDS